MDANDEKRVRIKELEEDIKTLTQRTLERETEMERYAFPFFSSISFPCTFFVCIIMNMLNSVFAG